MKVKTSELDDVALSWAVHTAEGVKFALGADLRHRMLVESYTRDWSRVGPIIEREKIGLDYYPDGGHVDGGEWGAAMCEGTIESFGRTALVAAMRCYVASKLGDEVNVPKELANA